MTLTHSANSSSVLDSLKKEKAIMLALMAYVRMYFTASGSAVKQQDFQIRGGLIASGG